MSESNKNIYRRMVEEGFNKGNLEVVDELVSPQHVNHSDNVQGIEGYKGFISLYRSAFPDLKMTIEDQVAEGDKVANRWTATGTHQGELMGIPPTGKAISVSGIYIARLEEGKIVEEWGNFDTLGMMQQLGVVPAPGG